MMPEVARYLREQRIRELFGCVRDCEIAVTWTRDPDICRVLHRGESYTDERVLFDQVVTVIYPEANGDVLNVLAAYEDALGPHFEDAHRPVRGAARGRRR